VIHIKGRAWNFGDNVDTDAIIPGRYLIFNTPEELAKYTFEGVRHEFAKNVQENDIVVAGSNFGCGSSREHAPLALKGSKVACVIAKSFARIFFRNAINVGLLLLEADVDCQEEDEVRIDLLKGEVTVPEKGIFKGNKLPDFLLEILTDGGLVTHRKKVQSEQKK